MNNFNSRVRCIYFWELWYYDITAHFSERFTLRFFSLLTWISAPCAAFSLFPHSQCEIALQRAKSKILNRVEAIMREIWRELQLIVHFYSRPLYSGSYTRWRESSRDRVVEECRISVGRKNAYRFAPGGGSGARANIQPTRVPGMCSCGIWDPISRTSEFTAYAIDVVYLSI